MNGKCMTIFQLDGGAEKDKTSVLALEQEKEKKYNTEGMLNSNCITVSPLDGGAENEKTLVLALEQGKVKQSTEEKSWLEEMYIQVKSYKLNEADTEEIETMSPMKDSS